MSKIDPKELILCPICEDEHAITDTSCVEGDGDDALIRYEDRRGI